jgi:mono/diheme cytochrome c family protein
MGLPILILLAAYAALFLARKALGSFWSTTGVVAASILFLYLGVTPPLPGSVIRLFTAFIVMSALLYITASKRITADFWRPIRETIVNPRRKVLLGVFLIGIPAVVAWRAHAAFLPDLGPPAVFRVIHPAPPNSIVVNGETIDMKRGVNPLRRDASKMAENLTEGRRVYYENCYFCHGDELKADGHYADGLSPRPISFRDETTIAMFTETFLFWRIAKGGPGLPKAATPWDSAMPAWEDFLTNKEMWQVILYLYDRTRQEPRHVVEEVH